MTDKVHIAENFPMSGLDVYIVRDYYQDGRPVDRRVLHVDTMNDDLPSQSWDLSEPMVAIAPTIQVSDDQARALLEALQRHYNGDSDTRLLRADYEHERGRVDNLITIIDATLGRVLPS